MTGQVRIQRRAVHGVLLLDKPVGVSSNGALQRARRALRAEKGGHTGTLDPLASGLMALCFGAATKFSQAGLDADKGYRATLELGRTTDTGDAEGVVLETRPVEITRDQIDAACAKWTGDIVQVPPMHSALKHAGKPLYAYARAGIDIERAPRALRIDAIKVVEWQGSRLVLDIACSKGTYIRSLAQDIGEALGCGAHLSALRRTCSGELTLDGAVSLDDFEALDEAARLQRLLPADALIAEQPVVRLDEEGAAQFLCGMRRRVDLPNTTRLRVYGPQPKAFLGSGHVTAGELIADRLLSPIEVAALMPATA